MKKADTQDYVKEYMEKDSIREAGKGRLRGGRNQRSTQMNGYEMKARTRVRMKI